ncbi:hypothetical protein QE400_001146 [Xanthomonas sacchari]|uniref:hypothetical protein n=1 Tax=Xanthomonas sacchari TaxID=56458 RepID=UPI002785D3D9|nr:hypothetical protein [Xanthomonas sacchari]MDQ1091733.1 hypothetical protein [Xanthomonas sacchari]
MLLPLRHRPLALLPSLLLALAATSASAAQRVDLHAKNPDTLGTQYRSAAARVGGIPAAAAVRHAELIGLDAESALTPCSAAARIPTAPYTAATSRPSAAFRCGANR